MSITESWTTQQRHLLELCSQCRMHHPTVKLELWFVSLRLGFACCWSGSMLVMQFSYSHAAASCCVLKSRRPHWKVADLTESWCSVCEAQRSQKYFLRGSCSKKFCLKKELIPLADG